MTLSALDLIIIFDNNLSEIYIVNAKIEKACLGAMRQNYVICLNY